MFIMEIFLKDKAIVKLFPLIISETKVTIASFFPAFHFPLSTFIFPLLYVA
jgi:hypothetical protein